MIMFAKVVPMIITLALFASPLRAVSWKLAPPLNESRMPTCFWKDRFLTKISPYTRRRINRSLRNLAAQRLVQITVPADCIRLRRVQLIIRSAVTQSGAPLDQYPCQRGYCFSSIRTTRRIPPYTRVADLFPWPNGARNLDQQCFQCPPKPAGGVRR